MKIKKYVRVTAKCFYNKEHNRKAKIMEKVMNWYIEQHKQEIQAKAIDDFIMGNMQEAFWGNLKPTRKLFKAKVNK